MGDIWFITGTDTGVGKTVFTVLLTRYLRSIGVFVRAVKPLCSGGREDAVLLQEAQAGEISLDAVNPWHFRKPIAPVLAARQERRQVSKDAVLDFLRQSARKCDLLLLGDKDQLASVESGAVLIDLVRALPENTVELQKTYRFNTSIKQLSQAVNRGDNEAAWQLLADPALEHVGLLTKPLPDFVGNRYALYMAQAVRGRGAGYEQVFATFNGFRVLCAVRHGHRGVEGINAMVEQHLAGKGYDCLSKIWYPGRPILITRNDYSLDLSNGDIGICLPDPADGVLKVWFERPDRTFKTCLPYRLPPCETAYALTIHKCQGSEFDEVLVVLPEQENRILSRELIYTAVTRAKKRVLMATEKEILLQALAGKIERFSGLKDRVSLP